MDPAWVGAWWMGFVVTAIGFLLVTFPLFGYPTNLPGLHPDFLLNLSDLFRMPNSRHLIDFIYSQEQNIFVKKEKQKLIENEKKEKTMISGH